MPPKIQYQAAAPAAEPGPDQIGRRFGDHAAVRQAVFDNALAAIPQAGQAENTRYHLGLSNLSYVGQDHFNPAELKALRLGGRTAARRVIGTLTLTDKASGEKVDSRRLTVAHVPYLTEHGTFLWNGTPTILSHQLRLDPGVYVRRRGNQDVEAHANFLPGTGVSHRLRFEPASDVVKMDIGQAEIPVLPMLQAMGATDDELKKVFGPAGLAANKKAARPHHLKALYDRIVPGGKGGDDAEMAAQVATRLSSAPVDPWVVKRTLGIDADRYTKDVALAAVDKVRKVYRGEAEPDDRDSLIYQTLHGPEHTIAERLGRAKPLLDRLLWQVTNRGNLSPATPGFFTPAVRAAFLASGLGNTPEGNSALEFVDHGARITKVGEGGLGRTSDAVPASARDVSFSHFPFIDSARASESETVGLDLRTAFGTRLGQDRRIYAPVRDSKTGKIVYRSSRQLADAVLAFPGWYDKGRPVVPAIVNGAMEFVPREKVDYAIPSMEQSFSPLTNFVQAKSASKAHRSSMGARMISQALPLVGREAPLVRTGVPGQPGKSFEELFGRHVGAVHARDAKGVVTGVGKDGIKIRYADGVTETHPLYENSPLGRSTMLHNTPAVNVGDSVKPGQLLAASNYTDDKGHAAYGANARVAFVPYLKGERSTYEDSILVSDAFAKRLTSEHLYEHRHEPDEHTTTGKAAYLSAFPGRHPLAMLKGYGDDGVVKPGTVLEPDQPIVMAVRQEPGAYGVLRSKRAGLRDASLTWDHDAPGEVVDVVPAPRGGVSVTVKTHKPLHPGDKISGLHGNKGVVSVVPDDEMPHDEAGRPLDVIYSSLGTTSRVNPSTIIVGALGKAAEARGVPYTVHDFGDHEHLAKYAKQELARYGLKDKETVTDPTTGVRVPGVNVGRLYMLKLTHMAAKKIKGRGLGAYDESGVPLRGEGGASRMSLGDTQALLSHGALGVLRDLKLYRGQENADFWAAYMAGDPPAPPAVNKQYARFHDLLRGAGLDPTPVGEKTRLQALKSSRVKELAGAREVKNAETFDLRTGRPVKGGLFDETIFGAVDSPSSWAKIPLAEPVVNPAFEEPVRRFFNLTEAQFRDVVAGKKELPGGLTGPAGLAKALGKYDVKKELARTREDLNSSRKGVRDDAARRLKFLKGLERAGQTPADWVLDAVPVLPPAHRPVRELPGGRGGMVVGDMNLLYKEVLEADKAVRALTGKVSDLSAERLGVYDAVKGAFGLGDPTDPRNQSRQVKGVLKDLFPGSSKHSYVVQKLLGAPADLSGRGQVTPNADLDMDEVGLPEHLAWSSFEPFVVRRLVRSGFDRPSAVREVTGRSAAAKRALLSEMSERPVTMTRYPALHRYNVIAQKARLVPGDAIQTNPIISKSMTMDYDGDTVTVHVPLSEYAVRDALDKMLPSKNLLSQSSFKADVYLPNMEFVQGLYHSSTSDNQNEPRVFRTRRDAIAAFNRHEVAVGDRVRILEDE